MKPALLTVSILLLAGCISNPEKECGMYDFDCKDEPAGDAMFTPASQRQATASTTAEAAPHRQASNQDQQVRDDIADLNIRVELLEEELRRRVDGLQP